MHQIKPFDIQKIMFVDGRLDRMNTFPTLSTQHHQPRSASHMGQQPCNV
jgi:hypothetical protein